MKREKFFFFVIGVLFFVFSCVELILCFFGPIVLDAKSTIFIYPLYTPEEDPEIEAIRMKFAENLAKSRKYIVIKEDYAKKILSREGKELEKITKIPSIPKYSETAKSIDAEKFIMGYILKTEKGIELFINIFITNLSESVIKETLFKPDAETLLKNISDFIQKLDGGEKKYSINEILYFYTLLLYGLFGLFLICFPLAKDRFHNLQKLKKTYYLAAYWIPELLLIITLLLFVYSYIYALNANMDYVQKFIATKGNIRLAQSTTEERIHAGFRYFPLIGLCLFLYISVRIKPEKYFPDNTVPEDFRVRWALLLTLISALMATFSMPSFLDINGWGILGFFCLIPLLQVFEKNSIRAGIFYGTVFGTFTTVLTSYWLGTFSLVSLQIVMIIFLLSYLLFMIPALSLYKHAGKFRFFVFPAAWVAFDYLQSIGFAGYPWGMLGVSQYNFLPIIQVAALTGVWGVTFLVIFTNAMISRAFFLLSHRKHKDLLVSGIILGGLFCIILTSGTIYIHKKDQAMKENSDNTIRIAQIQDSMDSRKHKTTEVLKVLMELTDQALEQFPDLIIWPEGSFDLDYIAFKNSMLVQELMEYQQNSGTWLLTGGMEYKDKEKARNREKNIPSYNSSMLLAPDGQLTQSYYKVHLVPFTEYFPYEKELPWLYKMLKEFDINWWEKGETRVIFKHPLFTFFTPICYEDVFPGEIALFVKDGGDFILNLSNDYWSMSSVEGKQHGIVALFRAVENNRPLLRTTTSGLTCYIDTVGRIKKALPHYETGYYVVDVPVPEKKLTLYTQWGDWFPYAMILLLGILAIIIFIFRIKEKIASR